MGNPDCASNPTLRVCEPWTLGPEPYEEPQGGSPGPGEEGGGQNQGGIPNIPDGDGPTYPGICVECANYYDCIALHGAAPAGQTYQCQNYVCDTVSSGGGGGGGDEEEEQEFEAEL